MKDKDPYQQILGIPKPWCVTDVELKLADGKVEIVVSMPSSVDTRCPKCQRVCARYDKRERRWRHLDTCQYQTVLVASVPRIKCPEHGFKQIVIPWVEERSRFTALFENLVIDWLKEASMSAVSRQLDKAIELADSNGEIGGRDLSAIAKDHGLTFNPSENTGGQDRESLASRADEARLMTMLQAHMQAETQLFKMVFEAASTLVKTTDEGFSTMARKQ